MSGAAAPVLPVGPCETRSMTTRDGVRLDADIYRPEAEGRFPVLLMRQPYGRRIASTVCYAHPSWYAARGYIVVIQDARGRGSSGGSFSPFENDRDDGAETIAWAAELAGSTGEVGMYGFSYQGTTQLLAAGRAPPALKAIAPAMVNWDIYADRVHENGAFCLQSNLGWAFQIAAETARLAGDAAAFQELYSASRGLPVNEALATRPAIIERHRKYTHYHRYLETAPEDRYWQHVSPSTYAETLVATELPILFIGGWFDTYLRGTLSAYHAMAARGPHRTRLVIGPWTHSPWGSKVGGLDFGPSAVTAIDQLQIRWFDHWLKHIDSGLLGEKPIRFFDMGTKSWRDLSAWPCQDLRFYLGGGGRAAIDPRDGRLEPDPLATACIDYLVHDPWRPAPSLGGSSGTPNGPVDRGAVENRADVLTFTTAPLDAALTLAGAVAAELQLTCDRPSFDVACVLSRVTASGQSFQIAEGYRSIAEGPGAMPMTIPMRATCVTLAAGERLRLSIAAAAFPAYPVNPGTGASPKAAAKFAAQIITLGVQHGGGANGSRIVVSTLAAD